MTRRSLQPPRRRTRGRRHAVARDAAAVVVLFCCLNQRVFADCFDAAASYQGVSAYVLRAIAWVESRGNPAAEHRNANGSIDIGELQVNSIHLRELAGFGIDARSLRDECVNIYVAAWHLKKKMLKYGNTWDAVGAYHSETPKLRDAYVRQVQQTLTRWGAGPVQFEP